MDDCGGILQRDSFDVIDKPVCALEGEHMGRVASISDCEENPCSSMPISPSVIEAQVYASFTRNQTLILASLTVFPTTFDDLAGAVIAGLQPSEFTVALKAFVTMGVIGNTSPHPPLYRFVGGARDLLTRLPFAQNEICAAQFRHDEYFLAQFTDAREDDHLALENEPYREFKKANLELAARRQIRRLVGLPVGATARPDGLTRRQWEVAQLVAAGRTNFQIAQAMGISEWTVVNHLRVVMRRLGCSSRVDVARTVLS